MRRPQAASRRKAGFAEAQSTFQATPASAMLADACAIIVFYEVAGRGMSPRGFDAMRGSVLLSPVTVWEITRKTAIGKLPSPRLADAGNWIDFLTNRGFINAPLTWEIAAKANALPMHHRDPMDRMLIATALTMDMPVITNDAIFTAYGVTTVW